MAYFELALADAVIYGGSATLTGGQLVSTGDILYFGFPSVLLDFAETYEFQVDYDAGSVGPGTALRSMSDDTEDAFGTSNKFALYAPGVYPTLVSGTATFQAGPLEPDSTGWADAETAGENHVLFAATPGSIIDGARFVMVVDSADSDTTNALDGRVRDGIADVFAPAVPTTPPSTVVLAVAYDKALAYPVPTMVNGRPT